MNSPSNSADGTSSDQGQGAGHTFEQSFDQPFHQIDLKAIRNLFKELEVKLDELRGHL